MNALVFSAFAVAGAWLRVGIENFFTKQIPSQSENFPWGIFLCNVLGSFLIGCVYSLSERSSISPEWKWILATGFLGSLTTFSTFSLQNVQLLQSGRSLNALFYSILSVTLAIGGAALGMKALKGT